MILCLPFATQMYRYANITLFQVLLLQSNFFIYLDFTVKFVLYTQLGSIGCFFFFFHVKAYTDLTTEGLFFAEMKPESDANPGSRKEILSQPT